MTASLDPEAAQQREEEKRVKTEELRERLSSHPDGIKAAQQLVQGGEHKDASSITSPIFLNRWLRARGWNVDRAFGAICRHANWRVSMMPNGRIEESSIVNELACEKVLIQGLDKAGRPVMIVQVSKHNGWKRNIDELERLCCYALDILVSMAPEDKNPRAHCSVVLDLTNMGALSMDIQAIKKLLELLGEHYVERLGVMYFFNPPTLFWGAWSSLSPLLPEPTRNKMKIIDPNADSHELIQDIAPDILPREFGGQASFAPALGTK